MATIQSQLRLTDGMSSVLRKINTALDATLRSFENVQAASGNAIDTGLLEQAREEIRQANNEIDRMSDGLRESEAGQEDLNESMSRGSGLASGLVGKIASMVAAYASLSTIKGLVEDSMEAADVQIGAQVQLETVMTNMGSLEYYDEVLEKARNIQSKGIYGDEAMIAGAAELATYFSDADAIMSMMDTLSNYAVGMSGGGAVDSSAMVDYATGIGKIMTGSYAAMTKKGFEFSDTQKAIIEGTATQAQIVAELGEEYLSVSQDTQAAATIGNVINESWAGLYETMSNTPESQIIRFNNAIGDIKETIGAGVYPAVLSFMSAFRDNLPMIEQLASQFSMTIGSALTVITNMTTAALNFATAVQDNWSWLGPLINGVVVALLAYHGALLVINAQEAISAAVKTLSATAAAVHAGMTLKEAAAAATAAGAQNGLNAALLASPITWIVALVVGLIAVFYAAVGAMNDMADTSISATGIITGVFTTALAFVGNLFVGLWNLIIDVFGLIIGIVADVANFIGNIFVDPVGAVARLFFDLADTVLGVLQTLASAIDTIFGSDLAGAVQGWRDDLGTWVDDTFGPGLEIVPDLDTSAMKLDRFNYGDAYEAGYGFGEGVEKTMSGLFDIGYEPGTMDAMTQEAMTLGGMGDDFALDSIADDVGSISDSVSVTQEELEYLRDIAERDAINRFTTAEVKIDMTGMTNRIEGDADLDGVISALTDGFTAALVTAAEGVHE